MSQNHSFKELQNLTRKVKNQNRNQAITEKMMSSKLENYDFNTSISEQESCTLKIAELNKNYILNKDGKN